MRGQTSLISIVGSVETLSAVRHWLDDGQPHRGRRVRDRVTLRLEPIRELSAQTGGTGETTATAEKTAALVDA